MKKHKYLEPETFGFICDEVLDWTEGRADLIKVNVSIFEFLRDSLWDAYRSMDYE